MNGIAQNDTFGHLLSQGDPDPVELVNPNSDHAVLLVCEHAGQAIPAGLGDLGISQGALDSHIGWDIGAEQVTRRLAALLGAPAILQRYSRLVIDCNRPQNAVDSMAQISDRVVIPGNRNLDTSARAARVDEIFDPYQRAVETYMLNAPRRVVLSIHSFTPSMNGQNRPWEIGFLFRKDARTSPRLGRFVQDAYPEINIGMNQPYQIDDASDWFVPQHGEAKGIPHSLIEIRNDQIGSAEGQAFWSETLAGAVNRYLKEY